MVGIYLRGAILFVELFSPLWRIFRITGTAASGGLSEVNCPNVTCNVSSINLGRRVLVPEETKSTRTGCVRAHLRPSLACFSRTGEGLSKTTALSGRFSGYSDCSVPWWAFPKARAVRVTRSFPQRRCANNYRKNKGYI